MPHRLTRPSPRCRSEEASGLLEHPEGEGPRVGPDSQEREG